MSTYDAILGSALTKFSKLVKKPERYMQSDSDLFDEIKLLSKVLYDVGKITEDASTGDKVNNNSTLPELIIQGFDEEQVWTGIQLQNKNKLEKWRRRIEKTDLGEECNLFLGEDFKPTEEIEEEIDISAFQQHEELPMSEDESIDDENEEQDENDDEENEQVENEEVDEYDILNDPDFQNMSDSEGDDLPLFEGHSEDDMSDQEHEEEAEENEMNYKNQEKRMLQDKNKKTKSSIVDDQFFKLHDMEAFLDIEDRRQEGHQEVVDSEEDLDLFEDIGDETEDKPAMYNEYFNDEKDLDSWLDRKKSKTKNGPTLDDLLRENDEMEGDSENDEDDMKIDSKNNHKEKSAKKRNILEDSDSSENEEFVAPKSKFELEQERLQKKIQTLEENALSDKPWQMSGEAAAPVRPENSLLAEDLDFVSGVRAAPVITEEVTKTLEDIIRQRIKDEAWDDVQRKIKPIESAHEYKKKLVLDQEKSKLSLAQIYEQEYLKITQAQEKIAIPGLLDKDDGEAEPLEVKQIKADMRTLFVKLDTLTHNHYVPRQQSSELKIVRNVPVISMEEVAPVGASNAELLAPAEIVDKRKGELMTDADKTSTDRKRERRSKKALAKAKVQAKAKKEKLTGSESKSKEDVEKEIATAEKQGKLKTVKEKDKNPALKSSTAFFNVLQDEIKSGVKRKDDKKEKDRKNNKISFSALKM